MPVYVNANIPFEELSKLQIQHQNEMKIKKRQDWIEKNRTQQNELHKQWAKQNKEHIALYREANRLKIREQYKKYLERLRGNQFIEEKRPIGI